MSLLLEALRHLEARPDAIAPLAASPGSIQGLPAVAPLPPSDLEATSDDQDRPPAKASHLPISPDSAMPEWLAARSVSALGDATASDQVAIESAADPAAASGRQFLAVWDRLSRVLRGELPASLALVALPGASDAGWWLPLAVAFTRRQPGRVLIVEGREPTAEAAALPAISPGTERREGLTDVIQGRVTWRTAIAMTTMPRVDLPSRGAIRSSTPPSHESFGSQQLRRLWSELKSDYALVLVAAGDVRGQRSLSLAASCDATMLLLNLTRTPQVVALDAQRRLQSAGARPVGCLLCD